MYVFDMDNGQKLIKQDSLSTNGQGVRGIAACASTHTLYLSYGGDGGSNGNGSMLAYNLLTDTVIWRQNYSHGIDSMHITPDCSKIYMPDGEKNSDGKWYVVDATTGGDTGAVIDTGQGTGDNGPHNTVISLDGKYVYMGDRNLAQSGSNYLYVADTQTNQIVQKVGPFKSGIRPFTINKAHTIVYTSVTGFLGFQVGDLTSGKVLYTVPIIPPSGVSCNNFGVSDPSHGISLSPDEKQLYVIDHTCNYVHVFDVSKGLTSSPVQVAAIPVNPYNQHQNPCDYDCEGDGWLQHSLDGRFVYVGSSGSVIDTATQKVITTLTPLSNTRIFIEIDWQNGTPIATSTRVGLGYGTT
jgi:hypothetical protein